MMTTPTYKIASIFQEDQYGRIQLRDDHRYSEGIELELTLLDYLREATVILEVPGNGRDKLVPSVRPAAPLSYQSDGEWIWPAEFTYYLSEHGLLPPAELVEHIKQAVSKPKKLSANEVKSARDYLLGSPAEPEPMDSQRQQELTKSVVNKVAAAAHEDWRKPRKLEDGGFEPRWKEVKDTAWITEHGSNQVDLANTAYKDLPKEWQAENLAGAASALEAIFTIEGENWNRQRDSLAMERMADLVHQAWVERNPWAEDALKVSYFDLSQEEKDKDRFFVKQALYQLNDLLMSALIV